MPIRERSAAHRRRLNLRMGRIERVGCAVLGWDRAAQRAHPLTQCNDLDNRVGHILRIGGPAVAERLRDPSMKAA